MVSDSLINFFPQPPMTLDAILAKANELREVHNHPQSTTTHLVAAILELGDSFASDTLSAMGLTANDLLSRIRQ
jgi:ATP-dependent Clp protease ATP-binding subunit ClpA